MTYLQNAYQLFDSPEQRILLREPEKRIVETLSSYIYIHIQLKYTQMVGILYLFIRPYTPLLPQ